MIPSPCVLSLAGVGKAFATGGGAEVRVLEGVTQEVRAGDAVVVTGPSGSGKTTLLHLMGLLDGPSEGGVLFEGVDISTLDDAARSRLRRDRIGMIFQRFFLLPYRSALDNVAFRFRYAGLNRSEARERAANALEAVGLAEVAQTPARLLSGGEMQRVAIARAVVQPPRMLIADEPTGNLDADSAARVMEILAGLNEQGMTLILATHNPEWIKLASRQWQCRKGRVIEVSP